MFVSLFNPEFVLLNQSSTLLILCRQSFDGVLPRLVSISLLGDSLVLLRLFLLQNTQLLKQLVLVLAVIVESVHNGALVLLVHFVLAFD